MQSSTHSPSPSDFETMATPIRNRLPKRDEGRSSAVTLQDVAQMAGVTSMTVSRVIKGQEGVSAATRERVLRIAGELNYTANLSARALATGKTGVIAVVSAGLNQYYYSNIVHLLESHITRSGYQMRLLHTHNDLQHLISSTHSSAVDGVIVASRYDLAQEFRTTNPQAFGPCVFIDTAKIPDADHVYSNLGAATLEALELMVAAGRKRIFYVGYIQSDVTLADVTHGERLWAYLSVMQRTGFTPELIGAQDNCHLMSETLKKHIEAQGSPDAVLCVNDETAMFVYRALLDMGYRIPEDVLLAGCDGLPFMECFDPPLSTIAPPTDEICALAWQFLQNRMNDPNLEIQQATFDAHLIVRKSLQI